MADASALAPLGGSTTSHLCSVKAGIYTLPAQQAGAAEPKADMTVAEFAAAAAPEVGAQMWNRSKKCGACGKINAVTMVNCNGCGASLAQTPETATENVPMGFVYGVAKTKNFPLKLSMRLQEPTMLVYDDPLARATCHMNAIPTNVHLPDWRWLLTRPADALPLLRRLEDAAWRAVEANFYSNDGWRASVLREGACPTSAALRPHCIAAFNAVVSQYQLHMHYIVPPFRPDSYHSLIIGRRFEKGRWLPMAYVYAALEALGGEGIADAPNMETAELLAMLEAKGAPNYSEAYDAEIERNIASHKALANWSPDAFGHLATAAVEEPGGGAYAYTLSPVGGGGGDGAATVAGVLKEDGKHLSSYGWGADASDARAPTSYYSFAKAADEVLTSTEWREKGGT